MTFVVYAAFGGHCDVGPYHGWVLIDGNRISRVGQGSAPEDLKTIDARGGALIPGRRNQFDPIDTLSGFTYGAVAGNTLGSYVLVAAVAGPRLGGRDQGRADTASARDHHLRVGERDAAGRGGDALAQLAHATLAGVAFSGVSVVLTVAVTLFCLAVQSGWSPQYVLDPAHCVRRGSTRSASARPVIVSASQ